MVLQYQCPRLRKPDCVANLSVLKDSGKYYLQTYSEKFTILGPAPPPPRGCPPDAAIFWTSRQGLEAAFSVFTDEEVAEAAEQVFALGPGPRPQTVAPPLLPTPWGGGMCVGGGPFVVHHL